MANSTDKALEVYDEMQQRGLQPQLITYDALIRACEEAGLFDKALDIRDEMKQKGVITSNSLVSECKAKKAKIADKTAQDNMGPMPQTKPQEAPNSAPSPTPTSLGNFGSKGKGNRRGK